MNTEEANTLQKQLVFQKQIQMLETMVKQHLSKEAITRYGNIKAAHPQKAMQIITIIAQLVEGGQIQEIINDEQGRPIATVYGKVRDLMELNGVKEIMISLSHDTEYAIAQAILVGEK